MIREIVNTDWPQIMRIQSQVYHDVVPEPLEVMQGKWLRSPQLCFVYCCDTNPAQIGGYILAHTWAGESLPELGQSLSKGVVEEYVFLHDLAISPEYQGQGVGPLLAEFLLARAQKSGWQEFRLVSVQGSVPFWQRFGFMLLKQTVSECYGEDAAVMTKTERVYESL
ncbi:GNAT family N-acetyltransferase [Marinomonas fungiae]|uniref:Ribosomal protein S18 acetylase RimI and related acetyltransferases n=1 Tax=Marinomonas fungiae TaxID=1137284 RepID=A0A0K6IHW2_9GAMM|nr:N-acetyltransferase [Marinomonas fungiae]CUB02651.1 Ribosomal protein S18 acetylase RimI and related acetyltransferases [Marinomonas fungiae]